MNNILKLLLLVVVTLVLPSSVEASGTNCTNFYGGGYTGSSACAKIAIDKKVKKPQTNDFVDNLSANDPKYSANQEVSFQITIQNVGEEKLTDVEVTDTLPNYLTFVSGPGSYNKDNRNLTFKIDSLAKGETQTFTIVTKATENIPTTNNGYTCVTNWVRAKDSKGTAADDSAQFCLNQTKKVHPPVLGVKQTPPTGPADAALLTLIGMGSAGLFLTRKTQTFVNKKRGGVTK